MTRAPACPGRFRVATRSVRAAIGLTALALAATACAAGGGSGAHNIPGVTGRPAVTGAASATAVTTRRIHVTGPESRATLVHQVAAAVPAALAAVRGVLSDGWNHGVRIEVAASQSALRARTHYPVAMRAVAAVTATDVKSVAHGLVLVNPSAWGRLSARGRVAVLAHELTHVATRRWTTASTPRWLSEGFADWIAFRTAGIPHRRIATQLTVRLRSSRRLPRRLPPDQAFRVAGGQRAAVAYDEGWLACLAIARRWGRTRLAAFYRAVGANPSAPRRAVSQASRQILGASWSRILQLWRAQLRAVS